MKHHQWNEIMVWEILWEILWSLMIWLFSNLDSVRKITRKLKEIDVDEIVQARKRQKHSHRLDTYIYDTSCILIDR